ncbi:MAG: lipase family protein [Sphingomicrobium sp.]
MPGCLHPKLLSICWHCYAPPGFDASTIGWGTGDPGPCGTHVDSALVGRVGNAIVVAYRGTLARGGDSVREIIDDWVNNAETQMVSRPPYGAVHHGFFDSHRALWNDVRAGIAARLVPTRPSVIIVTGHSKGGALAVLGAAAIRREWDIPVHVVTFASPRAGGRAFADGYAALRIPTLRYENRADLVPYLPLGESPQPFVRAVLKALSAKYPVTGYVAVGDALVDGPNALAVSLDWLGLAFRLARARNLLKSAVPLIEAHRIDQREGEGVYPTMAAGQQRRCAGQRHPECLAALG